MNNVVYPSLRNQSVRATGAGRILATLILGFAGAAACAQDNASTNASGLLTPPTVQAASLQNGAERLNGPSSRVTLSSGSQAASSTNNGISASSVPPPATGTAGTASTAYSQSGIAYGSNGGNQIGYVPIIVPHGAVDHDEAAWAGPVMPDERERGPRRLSMEERLRLRSDIRDASRNMYEHPRSTR